jgi:hypothetical protein
MPTIPLPEVEEPDPRAEQARTIIRQAMKSVGVTERRSLVVVLAILALGLAGTSSPNRIITAIAAVAVTVLALTIEPHK